MSSYKLSEDGRKRLQTMISTTDGFVIAEADLKLRGPGDIDGTQQSGAPFDLRIASLATDGQLLQLARNAASDMLTNDSGLNQPENILLKSNIQKQLSVEVDWGKIS
jgi:ATP-dependent DNA helicase RecG